MTRQHYYNSTQQPIGNLHEGIFRKKVKSSKHLMKIYDAWAIEEEIVQEIRFAGCEEIRLLDTDTGTIYSTTFQNFLEKEIY